LSTDLSARGLDFHDVDWIIQYDPPQDPSFFIHRIGRTARIGREGNAIVYIMPGEEAFVEFLGLKNVPIHEMKPEEPEKNYLAAVKKITQTEREAMEKVPPVSLSRRSLVLMIW
jgi:ATP-dependent RNA helicase DDX55/SPB4